MLLYLLLGGLCPLLAGRDFPLENSQFNILGKGWQAFEYGAKDTEIYTAFSAVSSSVPMLLQITDLSSPGSAFRVVANDERILTTPIPAQDLSKGPTVNPLRAHNSNAWSHGQAVLPAGFSHIRVFMRYSPYGSGLGALQVEPMRLCTGLTGRVVIVHNPVDWDTAQSVCAALGGRLLDLSTARRNSPLDNQRRIARIFRLLTECKVENGMAWIRGKRSEQFPEEDEFPASIKAFNSYEGLTGAEWEMSQMATLCKL